MTAMKKNDIKSLMNDFQRGDTGAGLAICQMSGSKHAVNEFLAAENASDRWGMDSAVSFAVEFMGR